MYLDLLDALDRSILTLLVECVVLMSKVKE